MFGINRFKVLLLWRVALWILIAGVIAACSGTAARAQTRYNIPPDWQMSQSNGVTSFKAPKGVEGFSIIKSSKHERRATQIISRLLHLLDNAGRTYKVVDRRDDNTAKLAEVEVEHDTALFTLRDRYVVTVGDSGTVITDFWAPAGIFDREMARIQSGNLDSSTHAPRVAQRPSPSRVSLAKAANLHPVRVVRLRTVQSLDGGLTIGIPQGDWHVNASPVSPGMPFATKITIDGADGTEVFLYLLLPVDDLASNIAQKQLPCVSQQGSVFYDAAECGLQIAIVGARVASYQWSGTDAAKLIARVVQEMGASVRRFSTQAQTAKRAEFALDYSSNQDGAVDTIGNVTNFSFINSAASQWAGQPEYWNFAFVSGCKAPAGHLGATQRNECAVVLNSIRQRPHWLNAQIQTAVIFETEQMQRAAAALTSAVNARGQANTMVSQWSQQTTALELQRDFGMIEYTYSTNLGTIQALGATQSVLRNPATGEQMTSQSDYSIYCERSDGSVFGTNDLSAPTKPACYQQLRKLDHP